MSEISQGVQGIHHISIVIANAQRSLNFYREVLGLRLVKRTVAELDGLNYELFLADGTGRSAPLLSLVVASMLPRGTVGNGQVIEIGFAVAHEALVEWRARLEQHQVPLTVSQRFGATALTFHDPDGMPLALVEAPGMSGQGAGSGCRLGTPTLGVAREGLAEPLFGMMAARRVAREAQRSRLRLPSDETLDLLTDRTLPMGRLGTGTAHHLAWHVRDYDALAALRSLLGAAGLHVTPIRDAYYFHSCFARGGSGILYELLTTVPGLERDGLDGETLALPPWLEAQREIIEKQLPPLA